MSVSTVSIKPIKTISKDVLENLTIGRSQY